MNLVILIGRLTRDIELQKSGSGKTSYCRFSVACPRPKSRDEEEVTDYPRVIAFGRVAENMAKYVGKGCMIAVTGEIQSGKYEKNGKTVYTENIVANRVDFLEWKKDTEKAGSEGQGPTEVKPAEEKPANEKFEEQSEEKEVQEILNKNTEDDVPF